MKEQPKPDWYQHLQETPWEVTPMSKEQVQRLTSMARQKPIPTTYRRLYTLWIATAALLLVCVLWVSGIRVEPLIDQLKTKLDPTWRVHHAAWKDETMKAKIFEAYAGGDYTAGKHNGCWWNLYIPYEQVKGSKLRIEALHKKSGMRIQELPEIILDSPYLAYDDFTRISSRFDLPMGGLWKFEMFLDDRKLGEVVFDVPDNTWEPSASFPYKNSSLQGEEGRLGVLNTSMLLAGSPNKYMWYFWGDTEKETQSLLGKAFDITATKKGSDEVIPIFSGSIGTPIISLMSPIADHDKVGQGHSMMSLPSAGMWRLDATVGHQRFGSVYVEVK